MRLPGWERNDRAGTSDYSAAAGRVERIDDPDVSLLVITRDPEFCAKIREIASVWKWTIREAPEATPSAVAGFSKPASILIIIYDSDSVAGDWKAALTRIRLWEGEPCVLLASQVSDQYLWDEVVRCGGYDVIAKSIGSEQQMRILRFAWFWKKRSRSLWNSAGKLGSSNK